MEFVGLNLIQVVTYQLKKMTLKQLKKFEYGLGIR